MIENLMVPQFKGPLFGVIVERVWCFSSLWICMMSNIHVCRKGGSVASSTVNRPGDVRASKCEFLTKDLDSVCFLLFILWCVPGLLLCCVFKTENESWFCFVTEIPFL